MSNWKITNNKELKDQVISKRRSTHNWSDSKLKGSPESVFVCLSNKSSFQTQR